MARKIVMVIFGDFFFRFLIERYQWFLKLRCADILQMQWVATNGAL